MYSSQALEIVAHCAEGSFYCEGCWNEEREQDAFDSFEVARHELWDYADSIREEFRFLGEEIADDDAVVTCEGCRGELA